jgi:hypothetical protein
LILQIFIKSIIKFNEFFTMSLPLPSLWFVCPLVSGGVVDEQAFILGGVLFGDPCEHVPFPLPPTPLTELWYIIESPLDSLNNFSIGAIQKSF